MSISFDSKYIKASVTSGGGAYCSQYQAVYNAMTNKPTAGIATAQNTMVQSLIDNGIWAKLDLFFCFAQYSNTANEACINWITPASYAVTNHSCTWVSLEGFTGNGSSWYLESSWIANTNKVQMSQNAATIGAYARLAKTGQDDTLVGMQGGSVYFALTPRSSSDVLDISLNDAWSGPSSISNTTTKGLITITRSSSTLLNAYINNSSVGTFNATSTGLPSTALQFLACSGMASYYSDNQISFGFAGGLLSATDVGNLYTAINTYMTSNGKNV